MFQQIMPPEQDCINATSLADEFIGRAQLDFRRNCERWSLELGIASNKLSHDWVGVAESQMSRWLKGRRLPGFETIARTLANGTLPPDREREVPPIDPRYPQVQAEACDENRNGIPCEADDLALKGRRIVGLVQQLTDDKPEPAAVRRDMADAVVQLARELDHMTYHANGQGVGRGF